MPSLDAEYGFLFVALVIFAGEIGVPTFLPGEIGLLLVGLQLIHSTAALVIAILLFASLDFIATSALHLMARSGGNRLLQHVLGRIHRVGQRPDEIVDQWRSRAGGSDPLVIFAARMIPVFRMYASLASGLLRLRLRDFFLGAAPAALLWAAIPLTIGFVLHDQPSILSRNYALVLHVFFVGSIFAGLVVGVGWWKLQAHRRFRARSDRVDSSAA